MAQISGNIDEKVFPIKAFLGLNENPDGDTKLKMGEAAVMRNWRITRDSNLQRRPGTKTVLDLETGKPIKGLWDGLCSRAALQELYESAIAKYANTGAITIEKLREGYFKVAGETPMASVPYMTFDKFLKKLGFNTGVN